MNSVHRYGLKKSDGTAECHLSYLSLEVHLLMDNRFHLQLSSLLQDAILIPWRNLPRKVSKLYFAMRGL
ncbi:hypothetical protein BHE74_00027716 [Ensete ventricosum]|nr:hypothetical protein BHE74_00027716 [Ensete ventricosum]